MGKENKVPSDADTSEGTISVQELESVVDDLNCHLGDNIRINVKRSSLKSGHKKVDSECI